MIAKSDKTKMDVQMDTCLNYSKYSQIYSAVHTITGERVAVRLVNPAYINQKQYQRELEFMSNVDHPYIMRQFQTIQSSDCISIMTEFVQGKTLQLLVGTVGGLTEDKARRFFRQIVEALDFLHNENSMVAGYGLNPNSIFIDPNDNIKIDYHALIPLAIDLKKTPEKKQFLTAPELLSGDESSDKADMWSLGIILYYMLFNQHPFYHRNQSVSIYRLLNEDPVIPDTASSSAARLILGLLDKNPQTRLSVEDVKKNSWFLGGPTPYDEKFLPHLQARMKSDYENMTLLHQDPISKLIIQRRLLNQELSFAHVQQSLQSQTSRTTFRKLAAKTAKESHIRFRRQKGCAISKHSSSFIKPSLTFEACPIAA